MVDIRFETFGLNARLLEPPKPMGRIHHHQEIELNYLFRGGVTYLHRWVRRKLPMRRLTMFWGATPHSIIAVEPGSVMAWITVPLPWVREWRLPEDFIHALMEGAWWTEMREETEPERYPVRLWVRELTNLAMPAHDALLLELQACLIRLAARGTMRHGGAAQGDKPATWDKVEKMARFIAENFSQEIEASDVARSVQLHPKYAMVLFRRSAGVTIKDFLLQHRITHSQRLLLTTEAKVIDIAEASGFRSLSAFYASFVSRTHETPNDFRRRIRGLTGD